MKNLHNLDLLRSFAVFLVLVDHNAYSLGHAVLGTWDTGFVGVFGVYLFFVHTCLVLMWSMERQPHVLNFYIRRIFRIYPLAITAILVALIFSVPVFSGGAGWSHPHFDFSTIVSNLLLIQDLAHKRDIVGVMWTLTIEVQMYVMLPALFFLASYEKKIWHILLLWFLAVLELHAWLRSGSNILPMVIPNFLPGVIAYLAFRKFRAVLPAWAFLPFILVLLTVYMVSPLPSHSWPTILTLGFALPLFRQISMPALVWFSQKIAQYSFGIYLWHSFGMKIGFHYLPNQAGWVKVMAELVFTALASIASYHLLEEPLIRMGSRIAKANDRREALAASSPARQPQTT